MIELGIMLTALLEGSLAERSGIRRFDRYSGEVAPARCTSRDDARWEAGA